ncbi:MULTISPECIES: nicotianamine synthase family protein [unclassified Paenibacillus]|uniref:nicotianamine synthase family protein n=1 Tax=unclassified Paenibacillus TaxID=185978 RepID=UPI001915597C|nr:nicotianamine synthase family protein [Paenibacillus sp. EPM92]
MRGKLELLSLLQLLEDEIMALTHGSQACGGGYNLLRTKLDELCEFMVRDETIRQWKVWGRDKEIQNQAERLREASVEALCNVEKYVSQSISLEEWGASPYLNHLFHSVKGEWQSFGMDGRSKLLFIGAGALPISVLTFAKEFGSTALGIDIDPATVGLANRAAKAYGLETLVRFSDEKLSGLAFRREATHIMIASLVKNKHEVLKQLKETTRDDVEIMVRFGNGVKSIFNYPFESGLTRDWLTVQIIESNPIYDTVILHKSASQVGKAVLA